MAGAVETDSSRGFQSARLSGIAEWLRSALFREAAVRRVGWRQVLAGAAFVVAGAAVSLARTAGPGALNTIWIEDAGNFLQDALHKSVLTTLTTQMNGYYDVVPRAVTAIAATFPLQWVPGIMSACAALQYAMFGLIAYIASGPHLHSRWPRLLAAAPACVIPLAYTQVNNDLATVQFIALYGTFWLLLWRPATRAGRAGSPIIMLSVTLSSNLPVVQPRYVIAPALLLYAAIAAMLRPRGAADNARPPRPAMAWSPVAAFALLLAVACGFNFRVHNNRSNSPPWTAVVAAAQRSCMKPGESDYIYRHVWWRVEIPCSRVRFA